MTDNEIIKALECCWKTGCLNCPLHAPKQTGNCFKRIMFEAINLINRQKAEIERLSDYNANLQTANTELSNEILEIKSEAIKEFAEKLKDNIDNGELYNDSEDYCLTVYHINSLLEEMTEDE